jgi:hypothetical protein
MIREIKYVNHINETLVFGKDGLYINESDLLDFAWSTVSKNNHISSFNRKIVSKTVSIFLKCNNAHEGLMAKNRLFEVCEKDVLATKHGKIIIGDYYFRCFVTESKKTECSIVNGYMKLKVKVTSDFPYWVKETTTAFNHGSAGTEGTNLDYNRDFPSDYTSNLLGTSLNNTGFVASNFIMQIHGACESPCVTIHGHDYMVNVSVAQNEILTIDSVNKTITLTHEDGTTENCFNQRYRYSYIFEKIPVGQLNVASSSNFKFDVILLEERSEPKWT